MAHKLMNFPNFLWLIQRKMSYVPDKIHPDEVFRVVIQIIFVELLFYLLKHV